MPTQLKVVMSAIGDPVAETEHQSLQIKTESDETGEREGHTNAPFCQRDLAIVLRALEINRSAKATFALDELNWLREQAILARENTIDEDWVSLEESDIHTEALLAFVQKRLFDTLFSTEAQRIALNTALSNTPENEALHLRLELPAGGVGQEVNVQLFQYPWEVLCYASSHLWSGRRVSFSRYIRYGQPVRGLEPENRLNVLVVESRPEDLPLAPENDSEAIAAGLRQALFQYQVDIQKLPLATLETLSDYLFDQVERLDTTHVLHFDGHGDFGRLCPVGHFTDSATDNHCIVDGCGRSLPGEFSNHLAFKRSDGSVHWVSADELADILRDHDLRLVVLNACKSGLGRWGKDVFNGMAQSLIRNVPAVVATSFRLDWQAAVRFARYFYQSLGQGQSLVEAMDRARQRLRGLADTSREWYRPILYLRQRDNEGGYVFNPLPQQTVQSKTPLIYIRNFDNTSSVPVEDMRELLKEERGSDIEVININWSNKFVRASSFGESDQVPSPEVWKKDLLPELTQLQENINFMRAEEVYLCTTGALSVGFAFGYAFKKAREYLLRVVESPTRLVFGSSDAYPEDETLPEAEFNLRALPGNPDETDGVVIVCADPNNKLEAVVGTVGTYLEEQATFEEGLTYNPIIIRQLLIDGFILEELDLLFDQDENFKIYYDLLKKKYQERHEHLLEEIDREEMVTEIVSFAHRQLRFKELVTLIKNGNPNRYNREKFHLNTSQTGSQKFKGVLFLDAEVDFNGSQTIRDWEAVSLARSSRRLLMDFVREFSLQKLHLFLAVPFGLSVFLGHQWYNIETEVQCYEWVGGTELYAKTCLLNLSERS